jgi:hypothetical protein
MSLLRNILCLIGRAEDVGEKMVSAPKNYGLLKICKEEQKIKMQFVSTRVGCNVDLPCLDDGEVHKLPH